jgi:rhodanese-related sulfurtransferase
MGRTFLRAVMILLTGVAVGLFVNLWSPRAIPLITPPRPVVLDRQIVPLDEARQLLGIAVFLDARRAPDYEAGHIAGAFNLPVEDFEAHFAAVAGLLSPTTPIIVYCDGVDCDLSHRLLARLNALGYRQARLLVNGWTVWRAAGLPTTKGAAP